MPRCFSKMLVTLFSFPANNIHERSISDGISDLLCGSDFMIKIYNFILFSEQKSNLKAWDGNLGDNRTPADHRNLLFPLSLSLLLAFPDVMAKWLNVFQRNVSRSAVCHFQSYTLRPGCASSLFFALFPHTAIQIRSWLHLDHTDNIEAKEMEVQQDGRNLDP